MVMYVERKYRKRCIVLRIVRVNALVLLVMLIWVQPARADWWDWLEELTAPGPSHSRGNIALTIYCNRDKANDRSVKGTPMDGGWFKPLSKNSTQHLCYFADVRRFKSEEDARFFPARIEMYEAGPTFTLSQNVPIEIGIGAGLMHIDSSGIKADRMTISFPRIVFKPLLLLHSLKESPNSADYGFFQLYFRETRVFGEFTASDFNTKPGYTFQSRVNGDLPRSFGFIVDGTLLVRSVKRLF